MSVTRALFEMAKLLASLPPELVGQVIDVVKATLAGDEGLAARKARAAAAMAAAERLASEMARRR